MTDDTEQQDYGYTKSGVKITEELIEQWADEAEAGYDLSRMRIRRGRPLMGTEQAKSFPVRLDPELRNALDDRAAQEEKPAAEIVREALRRYLEAS
jgi:hypothetical protein